MFHEFLHALLLKGGTAGAGICLALLLTVPGVSHPDVQGLASLYDMWAMYGLTWSCLQDSLDFITSPISLSPPKYLSVSTWVLGSNH